MTELEKTPEYIVVGRFGRTFGVFGEIYINPLTDFPDRFQKGETFWIESETGWEKIRLASVKASHPRPIVSVEGKNNPDDAKKLTNVFLYIEKDKLRKLPDGRYYSFDLIGCQVLDEKGKSYGLVTEVEEYPANDVLVIEAKNGGRYLFPMIREYIREVDTDGKKIIIDPPGGIFDSSDEN